MAVMTSTEFVKKLKDVVANYKTLYVMGCFGSPMNAVNKNRYCNNHSYNKQASRTAKIKAASADTFGFDCVCLIKGILWGWKGDKNKSYGGATYAANGVPDIDADEMIAKCSGISTDFSSIAIGEAVWCKGHIGVYIGNGLAIECTPAWKNCVQITAVKNIGTKSGYNARTWTKHGKLPYIDYAKASATTTTTATKKTVTQLANEVLAGKWGNGSERKRKLTQAGYDYSAVQAMVDKLCAQKANAAPKVSYFKKYTGTSGSIVVALNAIGATSSYAYRGKIAKANNIKLYVGTAAQNTKMLNLLKQGKLIKP